MEIVKKSGAIIGKVFDAFKQDLETQEKATEEHFKTVQTKLRYKTGLKLTKMCHESKKNADSLQAEKELKLRDMQYTTLLGLQSV